MRTLVVGVAAALLGVAVLTFAAAPALADDPPATPDATSSPGPSTTAPSPPADPTTPPPQQTTTAPAPVALPDPVVTITCTRIDVEVYSPSGSGRQFAVAQGRAEKGTPKFLPVSAPLSGRFLFQMVVDPGQATAWIFELRSAEGVTLWSRSGTTVPCAAEPKFKYTAAYRVEPVVACGKTLADVRFPSTPGIVYSYDEWNAYARLQPGWLWDYDAFDPPHAWYLQGNTSTSDLAWLPRSAFFMDGRGCPRYASVQPPRSQVPGLAEWKGMGTVTVAARGPATVQNAPARQADPGTAHRTEAPSAAAVAAEGPRTSASPAAAPTSSEAAAPTPSPSSTQASEAQPRVTPSSGLAAAGGAVGACALTVAGAAAFRLRYRLLPLAAEPDAPAPGEIGGTD